jgi:hypothetical protein
MVMAGILPPAVPAALAGWCFHHCMQRALRGTSISGRDFEVATQYCALWCGIVYTASIGADYMKWLRAVGLIGEAGTAAAKGAGTATAKAGAGLGATGAAAAAATLAALAWLGWKLSVADENPPPSAGPGEPPPEGTAWPCAGFVGQPLYKTKGWGVDAAHLTKSGCQVAIEDAMANARQVCAGVSGQCGGNCPPGERCVAVPLAQSVKNMTHLFWCGARVHFRCACYCV